MFKIFFGHFWDRQGVFWVFRGPYRGKMIVDHFFGPFFLCPPSRILPIGYLRGPKVFKKKISKKNFPPGQIFQIFGGLGKKRFWRTFLVFFLCPPSGNLPIGSLRGPKVFKKKISKKNFTLERNSLFSIIFFFVATPQNGEM